MGHPTALMGSIATSALLALVCSSCKEPTGEKPSGEQVQPATTTEVPTNPETPPTTPAPQPDRLPGHDVFYYAKGKLFRQSAGSKRVALTTFAKPKFCASDPGHNALWMLDTSGLSVYDLESKAKQLVVKSAKKPIETFEVRFGDGMGKVGNANELQDMAALVLMLTPAEVSLRTEVLCDGDLSHYCFVEEGDDPEVWEYTKELKELLAGYKSLRLRTDSNAILQTLALREAESVVTDPQVIPTAPELVVDKSNCEVEPDACGTGEFLGGNYWKIISGNSRGDFYHESYGLYDSKRASWVKPETGQLVKNPSNATFELLELAPDRLSMLTASGVWFSFQEGTTTLKLGKDSAFCGYGK